MSIFAFLIISLLRIVLISNRIFFFMLRLTGRLLSSEGYTAFPVNSSRCCDYGNYENYVFLCLVAEDSLEELPLLEEEDDEDEEDLDRSSF